MTVFVPTGDSNVVERLFAGWNGSKLYCCRRGTGWSVSTSMPADFGECRTKWLKDCDFVIS